MDPSLKMIMTSILQDCLVPLIKISWLDIHFFFFQRNFRIMLLNFTSCQGKHINKSNIFCVDCDWNYIRSFNQFGQNCHLNINFLIYEIGVFLSLFSSLIFFTILSRFQYRCLMFLLNLFLNSVFYAAYKWIFKFITNYL